MQRAVLNSTISRLVSFSLSRQISQTSTVLCKDKKPIDIIDVEDDRALPIPIYGQKEGETLDLKKSRLLYQSRKRGMLENGLLLSTFADRYLKTMSEEQTHLYDQLINLPSNDWDIFYWACNIKPTPPEFDNEIMDLFKKHVSNPDKETRLRQPDL